MTVRLRIILALVIVGCSQNRPKNLELKLLFRKDASPNLSLLRSQSQHMKVSLDSLGGWHHEVKILPKYWDALSIESLNFPKSESDRLLIQIEIWGENSRKTFQGSKNVSSEDYKNSTGPFSILLHPSF